jgi:hypothetical protein
MLNNLGFLAIKLFGAMTPHLLDILSNHINCFLIIWTEQHALKNVNNCLNTDIYSYLETSGGQSFILYLNVVHFFNASLN